MKVFNIERTLDEGRSPDFDHVLMLVAIQLPDESLTGYVIEQVAGNVWDWAPEVQHDEKHDVLVNGMPRGVYPWNVLTGNSGQDRYTGAVMHPSELWSRCHVDDLVRLADHPGHALLFTVVEVRDDDGSLPDGDPIGWAVAYKLID